MRNTRRFIRVAFELALLAFLMLALVFVLREITVSNPNTSEVQPNVTNTPTYSVESEIIATQEVLEKQPEEYPPPKDTVEPYPEPYPQPAITEPIEEPTPIQQPTVTPIPDKPYPDTPPLKTDVAVTVHNGDIWLVRSESTPEALTNFGDVTSVYGWNRDGTMILFGRGYYKHPQLMGTSTELWVLEVSTRNSVQLVDNKVIKSASWSPTLNQIGFCLSGDILTIVALDGEVLNQVDHIICDFTWSPDGSSIALGTYTDDMIDSDGLKTTALAIWWPIEGKIQLLSEAKDEVHRWPIWSVDGDSILFQRTSYNSDKEDFNMWNKVRVSIEGIYILNNPPESAEEIRRSPRADWVAYRVGSDIYIMDFEGNYKLIGQGHSLFWLSDGMTLVYRNEDDSFQYITLDFDILESAFGGQWPSPSLNIFPEYYVHLGEEP
jgi:hypothetical protein